MTILSIVLKQSVFFAMPNSVLKKRLTFLEIEFFFINMHFLVFLACV